MSDRQAMLGGTLEVVRARGALFGARCAVDAVNPILSYASPDVLIILQLPGRAAARWCFADFVRHWRQDKSRALASFEYDFAIAIWERDQAALYLARAPLSEFGLAYRCQANGAAFATLAPALFERDAVNVERLVLPLGRRPVFGAAGTAFRNVHIVECGTIVRIAERGPTTERFWDPATIQPAGRPDAEAAENLRAQTELAVADTLAGSGGDVASYLSAGRDSGLVTAIAARQLARDGRDLDAFTAVPRDGYAGLDGRYLYDEGPDAARIAASYPNVRHHYFRSSRFALCEALDRVNSALPAPYGTPVNLAWYGGIQREAGQRGAKLLLSGGTGNLTVSTGGPWAIPDLLDDHFLLWAQAVRRAARARGASVLNLLHISLGPRVPAAVHRAVESVTRRRPAPLAAPFLKGALRAAFDELDAPGDHRPPRHYRASVEQALAETDLHDPNGEALFGVTVRDPTADLRVVRAALELTPRQIASPYDQRPIFERAFADYLPDSTLRSPLRGAQSADWNEVICRDELSRGLRRYGENSKVRELIDVDGLIASLDQWPEGIAVDDPRQTLFTSHVLPLTSMASFLFVHCGG